MMKQFISLFCVITIFSAVNSQSLQTLENPPVIPSNAGWNEVCLLISEVGPCKAALTRFFYNDQKKDCEGFIYGGCGGNYNNFATYDECRAFCVQSNVTDSTGKGRTPSGFSESEDVKIQNILPSVTNNQPTLNNSNTSLPSLSSDQNNGNDNNNSSHGHRHRWRDNWPIFGGIIAGFYALFNSLFW